MREQTCCFSGHRNLTPARPQHIYNLLAKHVLALIHSSVSVFICGGACGFDTLAALSVLKARALYPHIRLVLALPSPQQTTGWPAKEVQLYQNILAQADEVVYMASEYHAGCLHMRNRYMVDHSRYCLCFLTKPTGGTAHTIAYAKKQQLQIYNLASEP